MSDILDMTLASLAEALKEKKISAAEAAGACLDRMEATEPRLCAMLHVDREGALAQAKAMDDKGPEADKPLWGVPVTVKDALVTRGMPSTAASRILEGFQSMYDAYAVQRLREAGAVILGKNNMDEFAMGSTTENSAYQTTHNPWNLDRVPGGSSGGSACSVAAGQCFASLGSDTGGSIRQPASFCGCVGIKPTYGRVSRYGLIAYGSSLDQIGPMARSVEDCACVLSVIAGHDGRDSTCSPEPVPCYEAGLAQASLKGRRIGMPREYFGEGLSDGVRKAIDGVAACARQEGAELVEVSLPHSEAAIATYYIVAMAEASSNLARFDGVRYGHRTADPKDLQDLYTLSRKEGFGDEVKRRILLGTYVLSSGYYDAYYRKAAQVRRLIRDELREALAGVDCLLAPVSPVAAWPIGQHSQDPLQLFLMDAYTCPVNLAGLPSLAMPAALDGDGMPVGFQLIGREFGEAGLFEMGAAFERALPGIGSPRL
ncbi:MAG: Asp-tRNA(Asn)/Glu-tRNA(Gln) amidotransferase subunit GatA [Desulfovibrio sp.]|jgi:aspartyl-tRNA(Asn)/glutamyl-tRNA(Gln) amidotransferase subunit A|nr:Asp-tRNA(Asn)/Glu-tRNA(Gln) amidotransferase subunit GatA [Desulfovibrio sp.]